MKKIFLYIFIILLTGISVLAMARKNKVQKMEFAGVIKSMPIGSGTYIIIPDNMPEKRYVALNLSNEFKKEDLHVLVIGVPGQPPPNVRMVGIPFRIKNIKKIP
jgi:hypothetical protein